ncbi:LIM and calponin homology domains-containing protein 1a isoform X4 [Brachyhypopomus gauderio]|uniref:LIM and calponin homology domains-containing protein 1a isoform X4 n=1 Tax=Brachyhypopomus gauderio TaxID=698409 RepID=UPI0040436D53
MASPGEDTGAHSHSDRQEPTESTPEPAFQEAQKWIEAVTGRSFGDKDFRNGLENGILLCELLSSIKPGLVKKINRLPTPIAGLDNLSMFLRGCEELGLKGSQLFDPGDLQDTSVRANLTGSDCSRKLKNVLITIYWLGKTANSCASYNGPTLDLKEFEGLLSMMRKECVGEESDSPKRSIRDSGYIDTWESERSESLSPPRHGREDSFDSLDSFGSRSQQTPSPDTVLRGNSDDSEGDAGPRKLPDVRKDDMSARRVSYKEPRAARPFNQYLPNKSNQTNYIPAPLRKRRSDQDEERRSVSNATSPVGGERPLREECVGVLREGSVCPSSQKTGIRPATLGAESEMNEEELKKISKLEKAGIKVLPASVRYNSSQKTSTWAATIGVETEMNEEELKKMRKLEKAGIKVLPASLRYNSPKLIGGDPEEAKPPSPDIILRQENTFLRAEQVQEWVDEDDDGDKKVPDIRKDDLASRRARMNQSRPSVAHHFLPGTCSRKDQERWEGIRLASQHAVLEQMEKMQHDKRSEADPSTTEVSIITRKDNPFLNPRRTKRGEEEESEEEGGGQVLVPNPHKDDLARRRTKSGTHPQRDPRQSLAKTSITQSDLEKWQRLSMNTENSLSASAEVPSVTREDILTPEKTRERKDDGDDDDNEGPTKQGGGVVVPRIQKDDLAKRRAQSGPLPHRDFRQSLLQSAITQSDMETWQRLKMSTENSDSPPAPLCQTCLAASSAKVARGDVAGRRVPSCGERRRLVTFGGVTEMESASWREEEEEEEGWGAGERDESEVLQCLLSTATVAMPTIGMSSGQTEKAVGSGDADYPPNPVLPSHSAQPSTSDPKRSLTPTEREVLELRLAEKAKDERKHEEEEEEEERERQPDLQKDDMMARRTGAFQKTAGGKTRTQFLPLPGKKKNPLAGPAAIESSQPGVTDPLVLETRIKTKRFKVGQRTEPVYVQPKELEQVTSKEPGLTLTHANVRADQCNYSDEDECDEGPLPDLEKDGMLARRTGTYHTLSCGHVLSSNVRGAVKCKTERVSGHHLSHIKSTDQEQKHTQNSGRYLSFTPSPVTTPPADVHNTPRKCAQMMESQETSTVGVMGGATDIVGGVQANSPPPVPAPNPRRAFFLEDDGLPPTFSHKAACVSDESESVSLIDMRDEEEADPLHNQFSKLREEEEQWQDDLARWKNRRRCASQDLIRKEEERKMMEKLMLSEGGAHRRKSIKTYKEIVEEKERREHELHESYCKASTPEEKAAVLQRYALRFTISDAILEKLQLPKLPSVTTTAPAQPQATYTLSEEVEVSVPPVSPQAQTQLPVQHHIPAAQISLDSQPKTPEPSPSRRPKTPEPSPSRRTKTPEAPLPITWVPPPPSKPVPLLTPKPYCQPKFSQISYKHVKTDGLVRVNGECHVEVNRESPAGTTPMPAASNSSVPLEAVPQSPQSEPEISPASEDAAQTLTKTITTQPVPPSPVPTTQETEQAKEETEDIASHQEKSGEEETSTTHADSQLAEGNKVVTSSVKCSSIVKTTIVTELMQTHPLPATDLHSVDQACSLDDSDVKSCDELSSSDSGKAEVTSYSLSLTEGLDFTSECIETPILNLAKRLDHWTWDPNEERKRQERWQQEQERLLQEKYQQEQERLKQEWEKAQKEVEEEERRHYEEERRILEETTTPLTPHSSALSSPGVTEAPPLSVPCHDDPAPLLAHPDKTLQLFDEQTSQRNGLAHSSDQTEAIAPILQNGQGAEHQESQSATPQLQFIHDESWSCKSESRPEWKKTASLDRNMSPSQTQPPRMRRTGSYENILGMHPSKSLQSPQDTPPTSSRSVSGKKLCSNCAQPLGKGAAMIIETLGLYFHIQCFKCGVCRGLLGETSAGTDVRIRNGVLSCQDCYIKSRAAGQPTTL